MAGGEFAREVTCDVCLGEGRLVKATRTYDGSETDHYRCEMGHEFGIHWRSLPDRPLWPPSPEERALVERKP